VLIITTLITLVVGWIWWRWNREPGYWKVNERFVEDTGRSTLSDLAGGAEQKVLGGLSGQAVRDVELSSDEINAWLAVRLEMWVANQGLVLPDEVSKFMVHTEDGQVVVAFRVIKQELRQIVSMVFDVAVDQDGQVVLHLDQIRGGSLPVDPEWVGEQFGDKMDNGTVRQLQRLTDGLSIDPAFINPANRRQQLRVEQIDVGDEVIRLRIRASLAQ